MKACLACGNDIKASQAIGGNNASREAVETTLEAAVGGMLAIRLSRQSAKSDNGARHRGRVVELPFEQTREPSFGARGCYSTSVRSQGHRVPGGVPPVG